MHTHISICVEFELYVHMYAVPSEVIRSNTYGCNCLEDNPAYLSDYTHTVIYYIRRNNIIVHPLSINIEPGVSADCSERTCGKSKEMLECGYVIIPPEKSLDHDHDGNKEGTLIK